LALNKFGLSALGAVLLLSGACAKKEPKPVHTEPWLAHPPASAASSVDAAVPETHYAISARSQIHFEVRSKRGTLRGTLTRVSGEFSLDPSDLARSHGEVQVDLGSLAFEDVAGEEELVARARSALGISGTNADAGSPAHSTSASFELSSLEDLTPAQLEPAPDSDAGALFTRKARATAVGNLLLHGFRVVRRAPLEAEFSFNGDRQIPGAIAIRSRSPFVISLETHEIHVPGGAGRKRALKGASKLAREVRVSIELYGTKVN
jgi:hypothetical protein